MSNKTSSNPRRHEVAIERGASNQGPGTAKTLRTDKVGPQNRMEPPQQDPGSARVEKHVKNEKRARH